MIVHHTGGLHMGIANGSSKKLEAAFFHILANGIRYRRTGRYTVRVIDDRLTVGHKAVQVFIERAKLLLHFYK